MKIKPKGDPFRRRLSKKAKRGYQGEPTATIAYYGPTDREATKVAVGIVEKGKPTIMKRWVIADGDIRYDGPTNKAVYLYLQEMKPRSLAILDVINGCPHEEGVDYPQGEDCPYCPFWAGRQRPTDTMRGQMSEIDMEQALAALNAAKAARAAAEEEE